MNHLLMLQEHLESVESADHPLMLDRGRYRDVTEELVEVWNATAPIKPKAIYQIGQVAAPGISDLDFVVVFPDEAVLDWSDFRPDRFGPWIREAFTHPPYCCPASSWSELEYWYPLFDLELLAGSSMPNRAGLDATTRSGVALGMLVDYFLVKIPSDILRVAARRPLRLRLMLCMLHSVKYTIYLARAAGVPVASSADMFVDDINTLRRDWFRLERRTRRADLARLTVQALELSVQIISDVDCLLTENTAQPGAEFRAPSSKECGFRFSPNWDGARVLNDSIAELLSGHYAGWRNPMSFVHVLSVYASASAAMRRHLAIPSSHQSGHWHDDSWREGLERHAVAMVNYRDVASRMGVPAQPYVGLGYRPLGTRDHISNIMRRYRQGAIQGTGAASELSARVSRKLSSSWRRTA